jgi:hypothetical protein
MTTLHHQLAEAQGALRDAEDFYKLCKANAEDRANVDGKNAEERSRKLTIAISADADYGRALFRLRSAEQAVDRLKADLAAQDDDRRAWEWSIRAGLVEALGQRREPFDAAMDETLDEEATKAALDYVALRREQRQTDYVGDIVQPNGHRWVTHTNCTDIHCNICEGGLAQCMVCGAAECELPTECPRQTMTSVQKAAVCAGQLDYRDDGWVSLESDPDDIGLSHGDLNSTHYAGQRRPQPTYSTLTELPDDWYKQD